MNKALYILGIVFSIIFFFVCGSYANDVWKFRVMSDAVVSSDAINYDLMTKATSITIEAATISMLFILFFIAIDFFGYVKVKTGTMKVMGVISMSISGLFLIWSILIFMSPSNMSFDEVGLGFMLYAVLMLAFSIVGLVQSIRNSKVQEKHARAGAMSSDLLDS